MPEEPMDQKELDSIDAEKSTAKVDEVVGGTEVAPSETANGDKPKDDEKKKKIIKISVIAVALIALIAGAVVLALNIMPIDYVAEYEKVEAVEAAYSKMDNDCEDLGYDLGDDDLSLERYKTMAQTCFESIEEAEKLYNELGRSAAVKRNKELKAKYEESKEVYDRISEDLKNLPDYYVDLHAFMKDLDELYELDSDDLEYITDSEIDEMMSSLTNSRFEELRNTAKTIGDGLKAFIESAKAYAKASEQYMDDEISYSEYREISRAFRNAQSDFTDLMDDVEAFERYSSDEFTDDLEKFSSTLGEIVEMMYELRNSQR